MSKSDIHPDFRDLEIEKAKTYLINATAVSVVDEEDREVMIVLHGHVAIDDTGQFSEGDVIVSSAIDKVTHQHTRFLTKTKLYYVTHEPADYISLTVADWLLMTSTKENPINILLNRHFRDSNL